MPQKGFILLCLPTLILMLSAQDAGAQRRGGAGRLIQKLSGPGPFYTLGGTLGAPLLCFVDATDCSPDVEDNLLPPYVPRWLDFSVEVSVSGDDDFEVDRILIVEGSAEWDFTDKDELKVKKWDDKFFASLGYGLFLFKAQDDAFTDFWRSSITAQFGMRKIPLHLGSLALKVSAGFTYFPTAFTQEEFGLPPEESDSVIFVAQVKVSLF